MNPGGRYEMRDGQRVRVEETKPANSEQADAPEDETKKSQKNPTAESAKPNKTEVNEDAGA